MILENDEVEARLSSPANLLNRLQNAGKLNTIPSLPERSRSEVEVVSIPNLNELVPGIDDRINNTRARTTATEILVDSLEHLKLKLPLIKAEKLSRVAAEMGKIITDMDNVNINRARVDQPVIVYRPVTNNESHYEFIQVAE